MTPKRTTTTRSLTRQNTTGLGAAAVGGSGVETEGFIVIQIGDEEFTLTGRIGNALIVSYHKSFEDALPLGTLPDMIGKVATALGIPDAADFEKNITGKLDALAKIPVLGPVVDMLRKGVFKITDLGINTQTKTYEFGFGVDTTATVDNIPIAAFGLKFTYPPSAKA